MQQVNTKKKWRVKTSAWGSCRKYAAEVFAADVKHDRVVAIFYGEQRPTPLAAKRDIPKCLEAVKTYASLRNAEVVEVVND